MSCSLAGHGRYCGWVRNHHLGWYKANNWINYLLTDHRTRKPTLSKQKIKKSIFIKVIKSSLCPSVVHNISYLLTMVIGLHGMLLRHNPNPKLNQDNLGMFARSYLWRSPSCTWFIVVCSINLSLWFVASLLTISVYITLRWTKC